MQHLNIVEDILDEDRTMATTMRQGWTLALIFEVGQSDKDATKKIMFKHEDVHVHRLGTTVGLATQPVRDVGVDSAQRHGKFG